MSEQEIKAKYRRLLERCEFMLNYWHTKGTPPDDEVISLLSALEKELDASGERMSPEEKIQVTALSSEESHNLNCPKCNHPRLLVESKSTQVNGGGTWLSDGDSVPGLYQSLISAGLEQPIIDKGDNRAEEYLNYNYHLEVGDCPACGCEYFTLRACFISDSVEIIPQDGIVETYFLENFEHPEPCNYVGRFFGEDESKPWLVQHHETPKGVVIVHVFGPFASEVSLRGAYGVSACGVGHDPADFSRGLTWEWARHFLLENWTHLKRYADRVHGDSQKIELAGRSISANPTWIPHD